MDYRTLIQNRSSVRSFTDRQVPRRELEQLKEYYRKNVRRLVSGIETELLIFGTDAREALEGAAGYNRFLVGAPQYMVLLSAPDPLAPENAGYMMEDLILKAADLGLDSCYVTFADGDTVKSALGISSSLEVAAIAAFGYGQRTLKRLRLNIRSMSQVDISAQRRFAEPKRSIYDLVFLNTWGNTRRLDDHIGFFDDVLWESFHAAAQAPSYLNRQAYGFLIHDGGLSLISRPDRYTAEHDGRLSLGIVLLHFSAVAEQWTGPLSWRFVPDPSLSLPEGHTHIAVCTL